MARNSQVNLCSVCLSLSLSIYIYIYLSVYVSIYSPSIFFSLAFLFFFFFFYLCQTFPLLCLMPPANSSQLSRIFFESFKIYAFSIKHKTPLKKKQHLIYAPLLTYTHITTPTTSTRKIERINLVLRHQTNLASNLINFMPGSN